MCLDPETPVHADQSQIAVDGKVVEPQDKIYLMLNKPRGVVTTTSDEKGGATVYSLLNEYSADEARSPKESQLWVAPVGRLDKASEGLLLFSNDTKWAARVTAPETHLDKIYHVQVRPLTDEKFLQDLVRGVRAKDGEVLRAKQACRLRAGQKNCWLEIVVDEGKNRHIRRMMEALGAEVLRLIRVAIGPLALGDLAKGHFRTITAEEKRVLDRAMREPRQRSR